MASFSIDDVRDTIRADVRRFLANIGQDADLLLSTRREATAEVEDRLREIGEAGHSIFGTSALVAVDSLSTCAALVERLAERAELELRLADQHRQRAHQLVELCAEASQEMSAILDLELEHKSDEAQLVALAWQKKAEQALEGAPGPSTPTFGATEAAPKDEAFSFEDVSGAAPVEVDEGWELGADGDGDDVALRAAFPPGEPPRTGANGKSRRPTENGASLPPSPSDAEDVAFQFDGAEEPNFSFEAPAAPQPDIGAELAEIFAQEAREHLVALQGYMSALSADTSDLGVASHMERLFHTLKGASATVGLEDVSSAAAELQLRMERVVEGGQTVDAAFLAQLLSDTNALLKTAGLPPVSVSVARPTTKRAPRPGSEERAVFLEEARELCDGIERALEQLGAESADRTSIVAALGRAFHRLKGSALVVGEERVAERAAALEEACDKPEGPTTAEASQALARIRALLGLGAALASPAEQPEPSEARAVFFAEARELCVEARALIRDYGNTNGSRTHELQAELARVFHRLKGSAAVVAEDAIATEAELLQRLCEEPSTTPSAVALRVGITRLAGLLGVDVDDRRASVTFDAEPVREAVEISKEPELWASFTQECSELLETIDKAALQLEQSDAPKEELESLLRSYHTLKGIVNTMGLTPTGRTLHRVEDFVEGLLAAPILPALTSVATFLLQVHVEVRRNLKQAKQGFVETSLARLDARAARVLAGRRDTTSTGLLGAGGSSVADDSRASRRKKGSEDTGRSAPWADSGSDDRKLIRVPTERLDSLMNLAGELVVSRSRLMSRVLRLRGVQQDLSRSGRRLLDAVEAFRSEHEFANLDGRSGTTQAWRAVAPAPVPPSTRTDDAASQGAAWAAFGELELDRYEDVHVLSRSLAELTSDFEEMYNLLGTGLATLTDDADGIDTIVSGIQGEITRARMVPVETLFARLRLPARDAAGREEKELRVVTEGEEVNIDKTMADALFQPMLHLVRNSVAHGIEKPTRRDGRGKPRQGTITLSARQESGQIVLEVRDDGAGLDLERLRARGVALGLVAADTPVDDPTIKDLVFVQGLSTHQSAGDVAGRGVGCDVVRRAVERLNGTIRVESVAGKGTTFVIALPLTLAITRALLVQQGAQMLAVPLYFAERILDTVDQVLVDSAGLRRIKLDGSFVPVRRMSGLLGEKQDRDRGPVLVLRVGDERVLVQVDAVVGQEEIVVKPLGELLAGHPLLAGVTIRGTGDIVLILDVPGVVDAARGTTTPRAKAGGGDAARALAPESDSESEPRSESSPRETAAAGAGASPPARSSTDVPRVLFVDDSLSVRRVAELYLKEVGAEVTVAIDGVDALAKLREGHFDIVFTDLEMPRMHGYELIRELRFLPAYRELPIVVVTSRSGQKHQDQAKALGASEYLTKPFTAQHLAGALSRWTSYKPSGDSGAR